MELLLVPLRAPPRPIRRRDVPVFYQRGVHQSPRLSRLAQAVARPPEKLIEIGVVDAAPQVRVTQSVQQAGPIEFDIELFVSDIQSLRDGNSIDTPIYDFSTHTRINESKIVAPSDLVVLDGILLLAFPEITNLLDLAVFIEASEEIRFNRRIPRDIQERGRTAEQSSAQFKKTVQPMHKLFVAPSKSHADLVIDGEQSPQVSLAEITTALYRQN